MVGQVDPQGRIADTVWPMKRWLYEQRKGPAAWIDWEAQQITAEGFKRDLAPHLYHHPELDVTLEVHVDDIYGCGSMEALTHVKK
eukprot:291122-Amphidinium_carterae.1